MLVVLAVGQGLGGKDGKKARKKAEWRKVKDASNNRVRG